MRSWIRRVMRAALLGFVVALFTTAVGCDSSDGRATARIGFDVGGVLS